MVEIDEFAVFPLLSSLSFRNKVDISVPYDDAQFWISAETNKNDLEFPIQLTDGTLDVRMLWLSALAND